MGKALYRKYRSKSLDEIVGQPHITQTLQNTLSNGTFSHAYLFTGPRGIGKTSIARILAHEVNQLPYGEDATHLDIIEIDAASNRRIDEIRDLRDKVHIAPTSAKYKVYIIDEVHMLTKEAFNALLKTLEEPPEHVIFILATTEAHKLPETIISRTQRFTFKPVDTATVMSHLRFIADKESIKIDDDALELIAQQGGGSFRDSISLLDQIRGHSDTVSLLDTQAMLGIAPSETIDALLQTLQTGTAAQLIEQLRNAHETGSQASQLSKQLTQTLRANLLEGKSPVPNSEVTKLLNALLAVPAAYDPKAALEIALLDVVISRGDLEPLEVKTPNEAPLKEPSKPKHVETKQAVPDPIKEQEPEPEPLATAEQTYSELDESTWKDVLESIKKTHNTLYSVARMASPSINGDEIVLSFAFAFHQKRLNETKNKQIIADVVTKAVGKPVTITCIIGSPDKPTPVVAPKQPAKADNQDTISTISNIFGGAEVLE